MKLIVGLGNPGRKYEKTRHNMGFRVVDQFADSLGINIDKEDFKGLYVRSKYFNEDIILFKPQTFMNLSGESVLEIVNYFKIPIEDLIIVFDDLALKPGTIRLRLNGSSGGQKGMQNIIDNLHTQEIKRIRIGIGEPTISCVDYVLGKPNPEEDDILKGAVDKAVKALKEIIKTDFHRAMSKYN